MLSSRVTTPFSIDEDDGLAVDLAHAHAHAEDEVARMRYPNREKVLYPLAVCQHFRYRVHHDVDIQSNGLITLQCRHPYP